MIHTHKQAMQNGQNSEVFLKFFVKIFCFLVLWCFLNVSCLFAQTDSTTQKAIIFSGYIETYYSYDFSKPADQARPSFVYAFDRHNEVNLNIGLIKAAYSTTNIRANLALMTGNYANVNLALEQGVLKNIFEANVGVKLSKQKNIWLDAGIFSSHIGFESAIGKDCWNLTRSILADNSPYYESGAKITYTTDNEKWLFTGLILNGWQRIQRQNGNNTLAFGHQIMFKPNSKIVLNSSSFIGSDTPDSTKRMRYFHNFYGQVQISPKIGMVFGFDIGIEQKAKGSNDYYNWYSPVVILQYALKENMKLNFRGEYYSDKNHVIVKYADPNGFQTYSYSANFDYYFNENTLWRVEARCFTSKDKIFTNNNNPSHTNYFITTSLAVSF
jgi:hypothetical protein